MTAWLLVLPVVLPLFAGLLILLLDGRRREWKAAIGVASTLALVCVSVGLMYSVQTSQAEGGGQGVYLLGNWPAPFGIVLVLDHLSALMLVLVSILATASLIFSLARWHRAGVHFHPLFQFFLMGLNGAFLTGDLFNLFVFFEVTLAASYGLALHGSGVRRVKAGLHYIAVNLTASFLFLIGVSLIYGVTGTLNMADVAVRVAALSGYDRMLMEVAAAVLGIAFLIKAGMWPLNFWLPTTYAAAAPPVAAMFAIMTKLGVYVVLRLWLLVFGADAGESARFGQQWLLYGGMLTIVFGLVGVLSSQDSGRLAGFSVLISTGILLAVTGVEQPSVTAGGLFYLVSSTMAICAFFLLAELIERGRTAAADILAVTREAFGEADDDSPEEEEVGVAVPATLALLGISFVGCAVLLAGLPPLSGFLAKFAILAGLLDNSASPDGISASDWLLVALLIVSGLATLIAMIRAGIRSFWPAFERQVPRVRIIEVAPVGLLLGLCLALTLQAGAVMAYMETAAAMLHQPSAYVENVLYAPRSGSEDTAP